VSPGKIDKANSMKSVEHPAPSPIPMPPLASKTSRDRERVEEVPDGRISIELVKRPFLVSSTPAALLKNNVPRFLQRMLKPLNILAEPKQFSIASAEHLDTYALRIGPID